MISATGAPLSAEPQSPDLVSPAAAVVITRSDRNWYRGCLIALTVFYLVTYGWLLVATDGLPYVFDNNESFSSLWHARNLYYFGLERSAGLTDEAYGSDPAAHPFVHTHQGNFPRLFALGIYALGARTVESQIVVTALTVGLLSIIVTYHFLTILTRPLFALIACLVLLTDYLGYAQWHVVSYRVWHLALLFGALLCIQKVGPFRSRVWLLVMVVIYLCLFYFELIFAAFTAIAVGLYTAWLYRRRPFVVLGLWIVQGVTAVASLSILVAQLIVHLGWDVFVADIYLTFFARNAGGDPASQLAMLRSFYETHNIVFFYNLIDVSGYRSVAKFIELHFIWYLQKYSPFFVLLMLTLIGAWVVGRLSWPRGLRLPQRPARAVSQQIRGERHSSNDWGWYRAPLDIRFTTEVTLRPLWFRSAIRRYLRGTESADATPQRAYALNLGLNLGILATRVETNVVVRPRRVRVAVIRLVQALPTLVALTILAGAGAFLAVTALRDNAIFGLPLASGSFLSRTRGAALIPALVTAAAAVMLALRFASQRKWRFTAEGQARTLLAAAFLVAVSLFVRSHSALYEPSYKIVWFDTLSMWIPRWFSSTTFIITALLGMTCVVRGTGPFLGRVYHLGTLAPFLFVLGAAYIIVYLLSPGYVFSGYLVRGAPLIVFLVDILVGLALYMALVANLRLWTYLWAMLPAGGSSWQRLTALMQRRFVRSVDRRSLDRVIPGALGMRFTAGLTITWALTYMVMYWLHLQVVYIQVFPPQYFAFLKTLSEAPYRGASFAVSTYAAPVAAYTNQWAYITPFMAGADIQLGEDGFVQPVDPDAYIWFADRHVNPSYARPEYFLCIRDRSWGSALERLHPQWPGSPGCSGLSIIKQADAGTGALLNHQVVARDESRFDTWVLVKLDWEMPPYLRSFNTPGAQYVRVQVDESTVPATIGVRYQFAHQDGRAEEGTTRRLVLQDQDGARCVIAEAQGAEPLSAPADTFGTMYVTVTPRTAVKAGLEYASTLFEVQGAADDRPSRCPRAGR